MTIKLNPLASWVEIHAFPNEFMVNLLTLVYPMIVVLRERNAEPTRPARVRD